MTHGEEFSIWTITAFIFGAVVVAKLLAKKTSTVDVLWLIVIGSLLGNLGIIPTHSEALEYIGEIGIVFIMFALGFEEDLHNFTKGLKKSWGIAIIGALFPFIAGYMTAAMFGYGHNSAMVWGLTMTATAVSLTMMTLKNTNMHKTEAATGIMTAAVVDDVLSLIGVAILIPIIVMSSTGATGSDEAMVGDVLWIIAKVVIFFLIVIGVGLIGFPERELKAVPIEKFKRILLYPQVLYKLLGIKKLLLLHKGEFTPLVVVFVAVTMGALAHGFGFHAAIGAYFAGLFLQEEYFIESIPSETTRLSRHLETVREFIDHVAFIIFGPIFFVNLGAKLVFDMDVLVSVLPTIGALFGLVVVFQVLSAGLAARFTGGYAWHSSVLIGLGMLGRAELAFIVINIAYVQNHVISMEEFYILLFTAFLLNITVPLSIKWWEPYHHGSKGLKLFGIKLSNPGKNDA